MLIFSWHGTYVPQSWVPGTGKQELLGRCRNQKRRSLRFDTKNRRNARGNPGMGLVRGQQRKHELSTLEVSSLFSSTLKQGFGNVPKKPAGSGKKGKQ